MPVYRMTMTWTGFTGSPGYTNLYFINPEEPTLAIRNTTAGRVRTWFEAIKTTLPSTVQIAYPSEMEQITTETGVLMSTMPIDALANTVGTLVGTFASPVGACVNWSTSLIVNGRKLRGRTFLVPMGSAAFQTDGTLKDTDRTAIVTASNTLASYQDNLVLGIWHRPSLGGADGVAAQVASASVKDKAAVLRSRRD
jgi:hypothetical protein